MYTDDVEASKIPESNMIHLLPHDCMCMMHIGNIRKLKPHNCKSNCEPLQSNVV